jgi:hypothetical protein
MEFQISWPLETSDEISGIGKMELIRTDEPWDGITGPRHVQLLEILLVDFVTFSTLLWDIMLTLSEQILNWVVHIGEYTLI